MIVNRQKLERFHSDRRSRLILSAFEVALDSVRPERLVNHAVKLGNRQLIVRDIYGKVARVREFDQVYIVGAGKAAAGMAFALFSFFGNKVTFGAITVPFW